MHNEIELFILHLLENDKPLPGDSLDEKLEYNFLDNGHIDSFGILQLILTVEQKFAVRLHQDDLQSDEIRTVCGFAKRVYQHLLSRE